MERRLQQLVSSLEVITDITNIDKHNTWEFMLPHPDPDETSIFKVIVALQEPWYVGPPINGIWIVQDYDSSYYRTALKLVSIDDPAESSDRTIIKGLKFSWRQIDAYDEIFVEEQYAAEGSTPGSTGPRGPKGIDNDGSNWSSATTYAQGKAVRYQGGTYVSRINGNVNVIPTSDATKWMVLSERGDAPVIDYQSILTAVRSHFGWNAPPP